MTTPSNFDPQPCCGDAAGAACMQPMQFCQSTTSTGPVEYPGRSYDLVLPINPGFTVDQLIRDELTQNVGITWSVLDTDGSEFAAALQSFIQSRMAGTTVTVTNPNAGTPVCGEALPMQIHIECLRLDEDPPDLVELVYNGGVDKILNPAYQPYTTFTTTARRTDAGGLLECTDTPNRGWETDDILNAFEFWGAANTSPVGAVTPTPRGTPIQEINANCGPAGAPDTIWQTFEVTPAEAGSTFNIRVVVGGRSGTENIRIRLFTGDPAAPGSTPADLIDTVVSAPKVAPPENNPWTSYSNSLPLVAGTYTLAFTGPVTASCSVGGLFTDMRAFIDRPDVRATAVNDDDTCVVTVEETSTTTVCNFWTPGCEGGQIASWTNTETGATLTNAEFWAQVPKPSCCGTEGAAAPGGNGVQSNLLISDIVCATIGGITQNVVREVLFDASGNELEVAFIGTDGARLTPDNWVPGECVRDINDVVLCDRQEDGTAVSFLRKYVQTWDQAANGRVIGVRDFTLDGLTVYTVSGTVVNCAQTVTDTESLTLCDSGNNNLPFLRRYLHTGEEITGIEDTALDGVTPYTVVGTAVLCTGDFTTVGLCLGDGTPIGIINRRTQAGAVVQDGWVNLLTGAFSTGAPPPGTMACGQNLNVQTSDVLCDIDPGDGSINGLVLVQYTYNPDGSVASTALINAVTGAPYTPTGNVSVCPTDTSTPDNDMQALCDVQPNGSLVPFIRDYRHDVNGVIVSVTDYTLAGVPYTVTGTVGSCVPRDVETIILCDSATTPNRFLRTYVYNSAGAIQSFTDTTLAGAPFVPTGAAAVCAQTVQSDTDFVEEVLSDANGTCFLRLFRFNSITGALISTTNTTLGGGAFTPVGAVTAGCSSCCPQVINEGCTNTGSGQYTAIRAANGTVTLIDSVTGATVTQANIVACPDGAVETLQARILDVVPGTPWTPAAVTGTITSLTATGIIGTWSVDPTEGATVTGLPAGYTATWNAEDANTLQAPDSITADVASRVVVVWTER